MCEGITITKILANLWSQKVKIGQQQQWVESAEQSKDDAGTHPTNKEPENIVTTNHTSARSRKQAGARVLKPSVAKWIQRLEQ